MIFLLQVRLFSIKEAVIEASPQDVKAELQLRASISALKQPISFDQSTELASIPIPGAGIEVPGIFKLGATIAYSVGVNVTLNGQGVVDFGLAANLPNSAKVTANLKNLGGSSVDGFGGTTFVPLFNVKSLTANVQLDALSTATIAFGIEVIKLGKLDMEVSLQVPKVTTALTAAYGKILKPSNRIISANTKIFRSKWSMRYHTRITQNWCQTRQPSRF